MTPRAARRWPTAPAIDQVSKALADPRRVALLEAISSAKEFPCSQLCKDFPVSKGTISHHMKVVESQPASSGPAGTASTRSTK